MKLISRLIGKFHITRCTRRTLFAKLYKRLFTHLVAFELRRNRGEFE